MIRNIVLLDGTWNTPRDFTSICKKSWDEKVSEKLIPPKGADGVEQNVRYFSGVGAEGFKIVGGAAGLGLRKPSCRTPTIGWSTIIGTIRSCISTDFRAAPMPPAPWPG